MKVETLSLSDRSWNGDLLAKLIDVQAEVNVPRHFHPVINAGVLLQGKLRVESDDGASGLGPQWESQQDGGRDRDRAAADKQHQQAKAQAI